MASQMVLEVKDLPASAEDIRDAGVILGQEDPLKKEMATHSSILTGECSAKYANHNNMYFNSYL